MTTDPTYLLIPTASLKPYKKNSRTHTPEQIKAIMRSIEAFGFTNPVLVWGKDNEIVAGHARLQAAQALGMDEVPCLRVDYLTDVERKALVIADNKIAETGAGWDAEMLTMELTALADLDFDIALTGFDMEFLGTSILEANPEDTSKDAPENDYENEDHEVIGEPDYSLIEGSDDQVLDDMRSETRKAIQIEFEIDRYEEAQALVKYWRTAGGNVGLMLIEKLIEEKAKHETVEGRNQGAEVLPS